MPGLMQGLEIARRALLAHQAALNVTGNNLANVATPGYTRQRAVLLPTPSERTPEGIFGTGVKLDSVQRARDHLLDTQIRAEMGLAGKWEARTDTLLRIEKVLNEPSDVGLAQLLDDFWNSWLDLSANPEDSAARSVVVQRGVALSDGLQQIDERVRGIMDAVDADLEQRVSNLNARFQELANLNAQIRRAEVSGGLESNLRDRRDILLDELAHEVGSSSLVRSDGSVVLRIGGRTVVEGTTIIPIETQLFNDEGHVRMRLVFSTERTEPAFLTGTLAGLLEVRDEVLPDFIDEMNEMTLALADSVNRIHKAGVSHLDFFRGTKAGTIEVVPEIADDISQVNAGSTGDPGDNDIAVSIAALRDARVLARGSATVSDYYRSTVSGLGSLGQQAGFLSESQAAAVQTLESQRQAIIGVNLDEELTRMITIQKAYEAAARVFSTVSDMLDTLLAM